MSLLPFFHDYHAVRPSRLLDQHFGLGLRDEDLLEPFHIPHSSRALHRGHHHYYRPWRSLAGQSDAGSTLHVDKDKFQVNLDVEHFKPEEITVKVTGKNTITIQGKHEEKEDEHGFISRQFVRRYVLPKGHDMEKIESKLSSDGVLSVTAPRIDHEAIDHRPIPIQQTGVPLKSVESKQEKTESK